VITFYYYLFSLTDITGGYEGLDY